MFKSFHPSRTLGTSIQQSFLSPPPLDLKRHRSDDDDGATVPEEQRAKRIKKRKARPGVEQDSDLDLERGINVAIGKMDKSLLADYIAQRMKRFQSDLSPVELEDLHIPESAIQDTSDWPKTRLLEHLPQFLDKYSALSGRSKSLSVASKKAGAPHTLVITSAGLRAADTTRALRTFQSKEAMVAKLFAKHIKLKDAIEFARKTRMCIGVGTPSRIIDLFLAGALSFEKLERIVIDTSYIDMKKRGIFDMAETQKPLIQLLNKEMLKSRYHGTENSGDKINLLFY